jgi:hypothetical protein
LQWAFLCVFIQRHNVFWVIHFPTICLPLSSPLVLPNCPTIKITFNHPHTHLHTHTSYFRPKLIRWEKTHDLLSFWNWLILFHKLISSFYSFSCKWCNFILLMTN